MTDVILLQYCLCYLKESSLYFRPAFWISNEKISHKQFSMWIIVSLVWKWFASLVLKKPGCYLSQSIPSPSARDQERDHRFSHNLPPQAGKSLLYCPGLPFEPCITSSQQGWKKVLRNNVPKPRSRYETCFSLAQTYATKHCNLSWVISQCIVMRKDRVESAYMENVSYLDTGACTFPLILAHARKYWYANSKLSIATW